MKTQEEKQKIAEGLKKYVETYPSQNKAAASLKNISPANVSQILNGNWDLVSDAMWNNLASQLNTGANEWQTAQTRDFVLLNQVLKNAQTNALVHAVVNPAGSCKTHTTKLYRTENQNAFYITCNEFWNRKAFLQELLQSMGVNSSGMTISEMMYAVVLHLSKLDSPMIMLDEFDKVSDQVMYFFISLYNQLEGKCAIIMLATDFLEKRITRGVSSNKKGYNEIYSRIGRKFIKLHGVDESDIEQICRANGVSDLKEIKTIIKESENDLRRTKVLVHRFRLKTA